MGLYGNRISGSDKSVFMGGIETVHHIYTSGSVYALHSIEASGSFIAAGNISGSGKGIFVGGVEAQGDIQTSGSILSHHLIEGEGDISGSGKAIFVGGVESAADVASSGSLLGKKGLVLEGTNAKELLILTASHLHGNIPSAGAGDVIFRTGVDQSQATTSDIIFASGTEAQFKIDISGPEFRALGDHKIGWGDTAGANYMQLDTDLKVIAAADIVLDPGGNQVLPGSDGADDLGAAGTKWRNVFTTDLSASSRIRSVKSIESAADIACSGTLYAKKGIAVEAHTGQIMLVITGSHLGGTIPGAGIGDAVFKTAFDDTIAGSTADLIFASGTEAQFKIDVSGPEFRALGDHKIGWGDTAGANYMQLDTNLKVIAAADIVLDPAGNQVLPGSDAADDLGAAGTKWRNVFTQELSASSRIRSVSSIDSASDITCSGTLAAKQGIVHQSGDGHNLLVITGSHLGGNIPGAGLGDIVIKTAFDDTIAGSTGDLIFASGTEAQFKIDVSGVEFRALGDHKIGWGDTAGANYMQLDTDLKVIAAADIVLDPGGNQVLPGSDNADDLGAVGTRWRNVFTNELSASGKAMFVGNISTAGDIYCTGTLQATGDVIGDFFSGSGKGIFVDGIETQGNLGVTGSATIRGDLTLAAGGDGALNFSVASSIKILDNSSTSLVIEEANNAYMTFDTTNGDEAVTVSVLLNMDDDAGVADDKKLYFGTDDDASIEYDEDGTNRLVISGSATGINISGSLHVQGGDPRGIPSGTIGGAGSYLGITSDNQVILTTLVHGGGGGGSPGGSDTQVQYNNGDAFGGIATLTYNDSSGDLTVIDDKKLYFGTNNDASIEYDENGDDVLIIDGSTRMSVTDNTAEAFAIMEGSTDYLTVVTTNSSERIKLSVDTTIVDDKKLHFGTNEDASIKYDEASQDYLVISGSHGGGAGFTGGLVISGSTFIVKTQVEAGGSEFSGMSISKDGAHTTRVNLGDSATAFQADSFGTDGDMYGEVIRFTDTDSLTKGDIYYLDPRTPAWVAAQANAERTSASSSLALSVGDNSHVDGMLLRGLARIGSGSYDGVADIGAPLYVSDRTAGHMTFDAPAGSGEIVRVVAHCLVSGSGASNGDLLVRFNPSSDWIELD